jgi:hypothetical protein
VVVATSLLTPWVLGPMVRRRHREELRSRPDVEEGREG